MRARRLYPRRARRDQGDDLAAIAADVRLHQFARKGKRDEGPRGAEPWFLTFGDAVALGAHAQDPEARAHRQSSATPWADDALKQGRPESQQAESGQAESGQAT